MSTPRRPVPKSAKPSKARPALPVIHSELNFADRLKRMAEPKPTHSYYMITLTAGTDWTVKLDVYTQWIGWAPNDPKREVRAASIVIAEAVARIWTKFGESFLVIDTHEDLVLFMLLGGHALVERSLADSELPDVVSSEPVIQTGELGFTSMLKAPAHVFRRRPDKKHRMRIFKRDGMKCRICGRRPDTNEDLTLHVHHIRPWASGGVTHDDNLITLCHTCHDGLDPHFESSLFSMVTPRSGVSARRHDYEAGVRRYREIAYDVAIANPKQGRSS